MAPFTGRVDRRGVGARPLLRSRRGQREHLSQRHSAAGRRKTCRRDRDDAAVGLSTRHRDVRAASRFSVPGRRRTRGSAADWRRLCADRKLRRERGSCCRVGEIGDIRLAGAVEEGARGEPERDCGGDASAVGEVRDFVPFVEAGAVALPLACCLNPNGEDDGEADGETENCRECDPHSTHAASLGRECDCASAGEGLSQTVRALRDRREAVLGRSRAFAAASVRTHF